MIQVPVWIIGQQWLPSFRLSATDHPVVTAFQTAELPVDQCRPRLQLAESRACADRQQLCFETIVDDPQVYSRRHSNGNHWLGRQQLHGPLGTDERRKTRAENLS